MYIHTVHVSAICHSLCHNIFIVLSEDDEPGLERSSGNKLVEHSLIVSAADGFVVLFTYLKLLVV